MAPNPYPKVANRAWRTVRNRAAAAPSTKFTPSNVAALLGIATPKSAQDNIVGPLRRLGLIDDDGGLTERGNKWRTDGSYGEACQEILDDVYPEELSMLLGDDGSPDPQRVRTWFDHQGFGASNARQMAATYVSIASKKIPESGEAKTSSKMPSETPKKVTRAGASATPLPSKPSSSKKAPDVPPETRSPVSPSVHLDVQIHIPADASPEQVDRIFASMAKHLYGR